MSNKQYTIGIDIGGSKMSAVLFDGVKVLADFTLATPHDTVSHVVIMMEALVDPLFDRVKKEGAEIKGMGIAVAGIVNFKEQIIAKNSPNLVILNRIKLASLLAERRGVPVVMDNDANCFTRAESILGAGKKYHNIYGITIGTGIGGGWWINNNIYHGGRQGANEPGRFIMDTKDKIDIEAMYQKLTQHNLLKLAQEAYRGDVLAEKAFNELAELFGLLFANIANLIDPEVFIIGGGAAEVGNLFIPKAKKAMREYIMNPESKKIKILKSKLGPMAGAIGAAILMEQEIRSKEQKT